MSDLPRLGVDHVALLVSVEQGRVRFDPRYRPPDVEIDPGPPHYPRKAAARLAPLKRWRLVALSDEVLDNGVRQYALSELGVRLLAEARAADPDVLADSSVTPVTEANPN